MVQNLILQRTILTVNQELEGWWYKNIFIGAFAIKYANDDKNLDWIIKHVYIALKKYFSL